jgi:hypothetical protein
MSLTSTIAYETTQQAKEFSFKGIGLMVAALIFGAVVGITIANNPTATEAPAVATTGLALDDFIRLNTTSYEGLVPVATAAAVETQGVGDAFIDMNVASYEGLAPVTATEPQQVGQAFIDMNVASYEGIAPVVATATHRAADPSFLYWNIEAFNNLSPAEANAVLRSMTAADRNLWVLNVTSYGYAGEEYTEQPSGPR